MWDIEEETIYIENGSLKFLDNKNQQDSEDLEDSDPQDSDPQDSDQEDSLEREAIQSQPKRRRFESLSSMDSHNNENLQVPQTSKTNANLTAKPVVQPGSSNSAMEDDLDTHFLSSVLPFVRDLTKMNKLSFYHHVTTSLHELANNT